MLCFRWFVCRYIGAINYMKLNNSARQAWRLFLANEENHAHSKRELVGDDINSHVDACWQSALATVDRIKIDLRGHEPKFILEIGASAGLNCFALQKKWPNSRVVGVEPEHAAVHAAQMMIQATRGSSPEFILGCGESIPLPDASVDLIVCHTVIEHVQEVESVIAEMSRVLSPHGVLHLEAPNYVWPYEPHLDVWCFPLLGKAGVKLAAHLQGKGHLVGFIEHLQFVTPNRLESAFKRHGLIWENRVREKVRRILKGDSTQVKAYHRTAFLLQLISRIGLSQLIELGILCSTLYPSVLYTCKKYRRD